MSVHREVTPEDSFDTIVGTSPSPPDLASNRLAYTVPLVPPASDLVSPSGFSWLLRKVDPSVYSGAVPLAYALLPSWLQQKPHPAAVSTFHQIQPLNVYAEVGRRTDLLIAAFGNDT